jgi:hypothetical protein
MNEVNVDQALKLYLDEVLANVPAQHPERTPDCVSLLALNWHVKGKRRLADEQQNHIHQCPFCRRMLSLTRKHCGHSIKVVVAETLTRLKELFISDASETKIPTEKGEIFTDRWAPILAAGAAAQETPRPVYPLIVEDNEGRLLDDKSRVEINQGPWIEDSYLIMRITLHIPDWLRADQKQLLLVSGSGEPVDVFELTSTERQMLKIKLPENLVAQIKQQIETDHSLPFGLVLRIGRTRLLAASSARTSEAPKWTICPTLSPVS